MRSSSPASKGRDLSPYPAGATGTAPAATPQEHVGQTMGSAELGRELGSAGGPLLVAAIATTTTLTYGYAALALLPVLAPAALLARRRGRACRPHAPSMSRTRPTPSPPSSSSRPTASGSRSGRRPSRGMEAVKL